jgi:PleD family two-component response regulator
MVKQQQLKSLKELFRGLSSQTNKSKEECQNIVLFLIITSRNGNIISEGLSFSIDDVITKPIIPREIQQKLLIYSSYIYLLYTNGLTEMSSPVHGTSIKKKDLRNYYRKITMKKQRIKSSIW